MILLIDNYDSFSYNLYQLIGDIEPDVRVVRNDELSIHDIEKLNPSQIIISPGPGRPIDAGICEEVISHFAGKIPILGVCLGHQAICETFGAEITYAKELKHGKQSRVKIDKECKVFRGLPEEIKVARYHSLAADTNTLPGNLQVVALSDDNDVMAVKHKDYEVYGLQFHPESILTPNGKQMLENFLMA
ncbi:aminodeoxychorismate/anthranilate synthase component II [Pseudobutyrivibrio ruminis]|uniref:Aminodeoxychorismate/anthranilate synthase component II n=2 Tax=Pseudobutyrivibrio TaxID=46205 RepID=A0A2G3E8R6_9FIRM|nr:aminodeoxychorismate/anthranilate synthase component II [Pseudobutyrivibrio ruminis]PHU39688.1 aminodeoxychorismate/anthranilate synthase component II [Pseudobutyrivibrio ruminis]